MLTWLLRRDLLSELGHYCGLDSFLIGKSQMTPLTLAARLAMIVGNRFIRDEMN